MKLNILNTEKPLINIEINNWQKFNRIRKDSMGETGAVEQEAQTGLFNRHDLLTLRRFKKSSLFGKLNHEACLLVW